MNINWYPGHMVTAINEIKNTLKFIDIALIVLDARVPFASMNNNIYDIIKDKTVIILLNKSDLADPMKLLAAEKKYKEKGCYTVKVNAVKGDGIKEVKSLIKELGVKIKYKNKESMGYLSVKPIYRVLIVGIPNSGKSTIINAISGKKSANVGNRPGVTKKKQWIRVDKDIELMDTPGLLAPNLTENKAGVLLALTGNIKEEILDIQTLALEFISLLRKNNLYMSMLRDRYSLEKDIESLKDTKILDMIGFSRGAFLKGGVIDIEKTSRLLLDDYKSGKIGRISLE